MKQRRPCRTRGNHIDATAVRTSQKCLLRVGLALVLQAALSGCDSSASVKWENKERTAMRERLETTISSPALGASYKNLTANLTEDERQQTNRLVGIVLNREPSRSSKAETLDAIFKAIASIRSQQDIRDQLPAAIKSLISIAVEMDTGLLRIAQAVEAGAATERIEFLNQTEQLVDAAKNKEEFKNSVERLVAEAKAENLSKAVLLWKSLAEDEQNRESRIGVALRVAAIDAAADYAILSQLLSQSTAQELYFKALAHLAPTETNAAILVKVINRIPSEALNDYGLIVGEYSKLNGISVLRTAIVDALRKSIALQDKLIVGYLKLLLENLKLSDPVVLLNSLAASVDTFEGDGFFGGVVVAKKGISDTEPLTCSIAAEGTTEIKYSFKWIRNDTTLIDWTLPSANKSHTSQVFLRDDELQCLVQLNWGGGRKVELAGEVFTVR